MAAQFSNEIWLLVLTYLDRCDLRCTRLTGRTLASLATPKLFHTLFLRPNIDSLNRIWSIADHSVFANFVRVLELRAESVFRDGKEAAAYMQRYHHRDHILVPGSRGYASVDFHKFYVNRPNLTSAESSYAGRDEGRELPNLFRRFTRLESVQRYFDQESYDWNAHSTFGEAYGVKPTVPNAVFEFCNLIPALRGTSVRTLLMHHVKWAEFERTWTLRDDDEHRKILDGVTQVKTLDLSFKVYAGRSKQPRSRYTAFAKFLSHLRAVEDITLDLDHNENWHDHGSMRLWEVVLQQHWHKIRSVDLANVACTESQLLGFISRNATSLLNLRITHLILHNEEGNADAIPASIIRTLWTIPYISKLHSLELDGQFDSCGTESWAINSASKPRSAAIHCLWAAIEQYACRKTSFPFPHIVKPLGFEGALAATGLPSIHPREAVFPGWNKIERRKSARDLEALSPASDLLLSSCSDEWFAYSAPGEPDCDIDETDHNSDSEVWSDTESESDSEEDEGYDDYGW